MTSLAVNTVAELAVARGSALPINAAMITFSAIDAAFRTGFEAQARWQDPSTGLGIADVMTPADWRSKLSLMGASEAEPIYQNVAAYFTGQSAANRQGVRQPVTRPPHLIIGLRSSGVQTQWEADFTTATAGVVTISINPSPSYYDGTHALAKIEIIADGVKTAADLRDEAVAALNALPAFAAAYTAAPGAGALLEVESDAAGVPLWVSIIVTTGGPIITTTNVTANTPGAYTADLTLLRNVVELSPDPETGTPRRWFWAVTDTQADDVVNAEGFAWTQAETGLLPAREAFYFALSLNPLNYDPTSAGASPLEQATVANGGGGWSTGCMTISRNLEWIPAAILGRCLGFLPGAGDGGISWSSRQLRGTLRWSRITPQTFDDLENMIESRRGNWYSAEGDGGSFKYAVGLDGNFLDRKWAEATARLFGYTDLLGLLIENHVVAYSNTGFKRGATAIEVALLRVPGIALAMVEDPESINVSFTPRAQIPVGESEFREMNRYDVTARFIPGIVKFGTPAVPITFVLLEGA